MSEIIRPSTPTIVRAHICTLCGDSIPQDDPERRYELHDATHPRFMQPSGLVLRVGEAFGYYPASAPKPPYTFWIQVIDSHQPYYSKENHQRAYNATGYSLYFDKHELPCDVSISEGLVYTGFNGSWIHELPEKLFVAFRNFVMRDNLVTVDAPIVRGVLRK